MPRKRRPARRPSLTTLRARRKETVLLRAVHHINGVAYGPGPAEVTGEIASLLRETESRIAQYEERFSSPFAALIMGGRRPGTVRSQQVAPEHFDAAWTSPGVVPVQSIASPVAGG